MTAAASLVREGINEESKNMNHRIRRRRGQEGDRASAYYTTSFFFYAIQR